MIIPASAIVAWAATQALPAVWAHIVGHTQSRAQVIERYCPPVVELPANLTPFQQAQYEKQCGGLNVYLLQATPVKHPELIGPPEPVEGKP